jgi:hypothetical protein
MMEIEKLKMIRYAHKKRKASEVINYLLTLVLSKDWNRGPNLPSLKPKSQSLRLIPKY